MTSFLIVLLTLFLPPTSPSGTPTPAKEMFAHIPKGANAILAADVGATLGQMLQTLQDLGKNPKIVGSGPLAHGHRRMLIMLNQGRKKFANDFGCDIIRDFKFVTFSVFKTPGPTSFVDALTVFGGKFPPASEAGFLKAYRIQNTTPKQMGNFRVYLKPRSGGLAWSSTLIIHATGPHTLLMQAIQSKADSSLAQWMAKQTKGPAILRVGLSPSNATRSDLKRVIPLNTFWRMLQNSGKIGLSLHYKGIQVAGVPKDPQATASMTSFFHGLGSLALTGRYALQTLVYMADSLIPQETKGVSQRLSFFVQNKQVWIKWLQQRYFSQPITYKVAKDKDGQVVLDVQGQGSTALLFSAAMGGGLFGLLRNAPMRR